MSANHTIEIENLKVGMFIHLDLGWWAHPFALSSFQLASADQIATVRGLGLKKLRWSPEKSVLEPAMGALPAGQEALAACAPEASVEPPLADPAITAQEQRRVQLAQQRAAAQLCERQHGEASKAWMQAADLVVGKPQEARATTEGLTRALLDKMMVDGELCIRALADGGGDRASAHALNVAIISMLMGRTFGLAEEELMQMGVGALMHDIGKLDLPARLRHSDGQFSPAEQAVYRNHVAKGLAHGQAMGLSEAAMQVIAQHHEMADGSGFPQRLNVDRISAGARIVSLLNRFDNLCNPTVPSHALTPHEALSLIFAQCRSKFDASMLNAFIRMMGVYPPGSVVQLTDDRYAMVVNVNSTRPLKPRVLVHDPEVPADEALLLNLEEFEDLGVRRSLKPNQLPAAALAYLGPRQRVVYFFEPAPAATVAAAEEMAA